MKAFILSENSHFIHRSNMEHPRLNFVFVMGGPFYLFVSSSLDIMVCSVSAKMFHQDQTEHHHMTFTGDGTVFEIKLLNLPGEAYVIPLDVFHSHFNDLLFFSIVNIISFI